MTQRKGQARKRNDPLIAIIRPIAKPLLAPKGHLREDRHEALADLGRARDQARNQNRARDAWSLESGDAEGSAAGE